MTSTFPQISGTAFVGWEITYLISTRRHRLVCINLRLAQRKQKRIFIKVFSSSESIEDIANSAFIHNCILLSSQIIECLFSLFSFCFLFTPFKHVRWDIDDSNAVAMPNTLLYTSYMSRIVATRCHAEGLGELMVQYTRCQL